MNKKGIFFCIFFDALAAVIVWLLFYLYRRVTNDFEIYGETVVFTFVPNYDLTLSFISFPAISIFIHYLMGYYNIHAKRSRLVDLFSTFVGTFFISLIIYFAMLVDDVVVSYTFYYKSFLILWLMFFVITYIFRYIHTLIILHNLRLGIIPNNVLVIGTGDTARKVSDIITKSANKNGRKIVGYIKVRDKVEVESKKVLGYLYSLEDVLKDNYVTSVTIAVDDIDNDMMFDIVNRLIKSDVEIRIAPRLFEIVMGHVALTDVSAEPFVDIKSTHMPAWQQSIKRVFDILVSSVSMLILSPVYLIISIGVKFSSRGPVFYKQERIGYGGKPFIIYKFRTMFVDAEKKGPQLSLIDDDRITAFGRMLRKYRLDELPQFWNIIRGDMSIVGPRPEREFYIKKIERAAPYYCLVYRVRPGLLSWGPIKVGYTDSIDKMVERLKYDIIYMNNMTLQTDIKILFYSVGVIVHGKGQ